MLGGKPLDAWPKDVLRGLFSAIFQDFVKYQFPVNDNIGFGALESRNDHNIVSAAEMAGAAKFIESLPEKYETMLGKPLGGEDLSVGEWQKLATARALIRDARIIILDEPTFGLGWRQKQTLVRFINKILNKKHCIIISHDEQFIHSICDKVLELDSKSIMQNPDLVREQR